ncbi:bacillithiol biosynthesis cysteine-adding enzyme BshC [Riemerella columbina]|uniref:bacillithiol biosynthesis cysteine-adding enzyme BshC n=1 Tax=Riemerella columbina TaxID=103810 RepID=UPI002670852F|nr:bacillithiol biosynthesis cysteine-adding enzyme BshC [Riemerella columbina]WKS95114.1 bacillithiol biosynthesis cysteine-adding enzyme BshC [Riemerella columbina]
MVTRIPFQNIQSIPPIIKDFLNGRWEDFEPYRFNLDTIKSTIQNKSKFYTPQQREVLHRVITQQYQGIPLSDLQQNHLDLLLEDNTFTVTTGHQLNLFTGPVFFIYKILQTIKTCEYLKNYYPEYHFVPIFWMATEDHDFEEINHFRTPEHYYELNAKAGGAVGRIKVEHPDFVAQFAEDFKDEPLGATLIQWMQRVYRVENTLTQSIRILAQELFSAYGLLLLDGDERQLKTQMIPLFKEELQHQTLEKTTTETVEFLSAEYGKVQVNPREINLFYLSETRNRIEKTNSGYHVVDTPIQFSEEEMMLELERYPERFSPNALLRPAYQETVLPNIAYVGGNAEVAYWLELVNYFKAAGLNFPTLVPRHSLLFISEKTAKKVEKSGWQVEDFLNDVQALFNQKLLDATPLSTLIDEKQRLLQQGFDELKTQAALTEKTFYNLVEAEETRQLKTYERMKKRLLKAERLKNAEQLDWLLRLKEEISPNQQWQERQYNFSTFYKNQGEKWLQTCYQLLNADNSELIVCAI